MTSNTVGISYSLTNSGISISASPGSNVPQSVPKELLATTAVKTKSGWRGQLVIDGVIVWETKSCESSEDALVAVNKRVVSRLRDMFA